MRRQDRKVTSLSRLITVLGTDIPPRAKHVWFRGQADTSWGLIPTITRGKNGGADLEKYLIKRFRQNASQLVTSNINNDWDWLLTNAAPWCANTFTGLD